MLLSRFPIKRLHTLGVVFAAWLTMIGLASAQTSTSLSLAWDAASDNVGVVGYSLERCQGVNCTSFTEIAFVTGTTYVDNGLAFSTSYTYRVRARDAAINWGGFSNLATRTTPANPIPTLVAAFAFDEGAGSAVGDASTFHNNGTTANTTWTASGKTSNALVFNGTTSVVTVPDADSLDVSSGYTVEAWVYPTARASGGWSLVASKGGAVTLAMEDTTGTPLCFQTTGQQATQINGPSPVALNTYTHLACTYDGANIRLYVNGVEVAVLARTGGILVNASPLYIGGYPSSTNWMTGRIDDVRVYSRGITNGEVNTDMATPVTTVVPSTPTAVTGFSTENVTNGSVGLMWNPPTNSTWAFKAQIKTFAVPTHWVDLPYTGASLDVDGKIHAVATFTAFPADAVTDHYMCFNVWFENVNGVPGPTSDSLGQSLCTQIPVPAVPPVAQRVKIVWSHTGLDVLKQVEAGLTFNIKRATTLSGSYTTIATGVTGRTYVDTTAPAGKACYRVEPQDAVGRLGTAVLQSCTDGTSLGTAATGTAVYDSETDFSGVQGPVWYYRKYPSGTLMTYNGGGQYWETDELYNRIWNGGGSGGYFNNKQERRWVCPETGAWTVSGETYDYVPGTGSGAIVTIKKNDTTTLYTRTLGDGATTVAYSVDFTCSVGDAINGIIDPNASSNSDSIRFKMHFVGGAVTFPLSKAYAVRVSGTSPNYKVMWSHSGLDLNGQPAEGLEFQVQRSATLGGTRTTIQAFGSSTSNQRSFQDAGAGETAFYWISAQAGALASDVSQPGCKGSGCPPDTVAPTTPYAVSVRPDGNRNRITWSHDGLDANQQVEGSLNFRVQRALTLGGARTVVCDWASVQSSSIRGCLDVNPPATGFYWVEAGDGVNVSAVSIPGCRGGGCPSDAADPQPAFAIVPQYQQ